MKTNHSDKNDPENSVADILHRLNSSDAGPAWAEFLDSYSGLIMKTASQFEYRQDRSSECFLYVCEKLNDDGFRRLLKFNASGRCRFRTWLGTVAFNLCVDWHRREFGRATLLPAISALPAFDRAVYHLVIQQCADKEAAFQTLRADFPDLTRELIENSVIRVYELLTPRQRWQILVRNRRKKMARDKQSADLVDFLPDPGAGPELEAQKQQDLDRLQDAMSRMSSRQCLLLRLRFQEGLSLKKIAEVCQLGDTNRAWRHLQAALKALFQNMHSQHSSEKRKN
ncbi:sigma-70 family RNA polymerase sigma factor [Pseudomonadota bacterium]